jgi:hypothetical protein
MKTEKTIPIYIFICDTRHGVDVSAFVDEAKANACFADHIAEHWDEEYSGKLDTTSHKATIEQWYEESDHGDDWSRFEENYISVDDLTAAIQKATA